jgi:uridylate kinase
LKGNNLSEPEEIEVIIGGEAAAYLRRAAALAGKTTDEVILNAIGLHRTVLEASLVGHEFCGDDADGDYVALIPFGEDE